MLDKGLELIAKGDSASICEGARLLAKSGRAEALEPLLTLIRSRNEMIRDCVRDALHQLDPMPVLLGWWRSDDEKARAHALDCAVALSHQGLMDLYREAAAAENPRFRKRAATGLRHQAGEPDTLDLLATLAADGDKEVRWWAIDTLRLLDTPQARTILEGRLAAESDRTLLPFIERGLA